VLFAPELRTALVGIIRDQLAVTDTQLLAYAIMPNHLHLVVRQGHTTLPRFMQPIVRRAALLVQRFHGRVGRVFERRYRDRPCADPEHLRNAIVYTHLNPVRARLCAQPEEYAWTSHRAWMGERNACDGLPDPAAVLEGLMLFATGGGGTRSDLTADYVAYLGWRVELDRFRASTGAGTSACVPASPPMNYGDTNWLLHLTPRSPHADAASDGLKLPSNGASGRVDLADIMRLVMADADPRIDPDLVRSRCGNRAFVDARHAIIRRATRAGYTGVQIAAFLRISSTSVSAVLAADRKRLLKHTA
jgi:REP element-mobilizing transposase RayT